MWFKHPNPESDVYPLEVGRKLFLNVIYITLSTACLCLASVLHSLPKMNVDSCIDIKTEKLSRQKEKNNFCMVPDPHTWLLPVSISSFFFFYVIFPFTIIIFI